MCVCVSKPVYYSACYTHICICFAMLLIIFIFYINQKHLQNKVVIFAVSVQSLLQAGNETISGTTVLMNRRFCQNFTYFPL